ncbi:UNVERIFIED_ORG: hypothetical protein ABID57_000694 [Arthrobacter sp. UYEF1]
MAISFIDKVSALATSVTLPTTMQAGDLIIIFAYRNAITAPSLPAGYTSVTSNTGNTQSFRVGYKFASGPAGTSGTWTSADMVMACVYRGVSTVGGSGSTTTISQATTVMSGIGTMTRTDGSSWAFSWGGSAQTTSMSTPTGTVLRESQAGAAFMGIVVDSNAGVPSWAQHTSTNGTNAVNTGGSVELIRAPDKNVNNYLAVKVGDGMSTGERIR